MMGHAVEHVLTVLQLKRMQTEATDARKQLRDRVHAHEKESSKLKQDYEFELVFVSP